MTSRINLINYLVQQRNYESYLEITQNGISWEIAHVQCATKRLNFPLSSNEFFSSHHDFYDIIFIDGLHTEEQVAKDIQHALQRLKINGMIILHDCMPPDAWHQRSYEDYKEGENWNGTVWKAVLREFNRSHYQCTLLDMDWGCGIIDTANTQLALNRKMPEELDYSMHYDWLLAYKMGIGEYIRKQVEVFFHLACLGNWQEVFGEQMDQLSQNGFNQVRLSVLGTEKELLFALNTLDDQKIKATALFHDTDLNHFEKPALLAIENYASCHNGYVLYLHSKGVSNPGDESKGKWRRLMMRELVDKWENCVLQLQHYDVIGVDWRDMPPISHFCGNFWYASSKYLRKLADFNFYYDNPRYRIWDRICDKRLGCEFWISSSKETPRVLSLVGRNIDFCNPVYWSDK